MLRWVISWSSNHFDTVETDMKETDLTFLSTLPVLLDFLDAHRLLGLGKSQVDTLLNHAPYSATAYSCECPMAQLCRVKLRSLASRTGDSSVSYMQSRPCEKFILCTCYTKSWRPSQDAGMILHVTHWSTWRMIVYARLTPASLIP